MISDRNHTWRVFRIVGFCLTAGSLSLLSQATVRGQADKSARPQVVVYLDEYSPSTTVTSVTWQGAGLVEASTDLPLEFKPGEFSLGQRLNQQVRLIDEDVPAGDYRGVRFTVSIAYARSDSAMSVDTIDVVLPLRLDLAFNETIPLFLKVVALGPDTEDESPTVELQAYQPVVPPFNSLIFVTNSESNNISVIDKSTGRVVDVLRSGNKPSGMAFSPLTRELFVANTGDNTVTVFDVSTRQIIRVMRVNIGDGPTRLVLSPDNRSLYVLNSGSNSLVAFDAGSYQLLGRFSVGLSASDFVIDPSSGWLYVSDELSDNISLFDPGEQRMVTTIPAGSLPTELLYIASENLLCAASSGQRAVTILNMGSGNAQVFGSLCGNAAGLAYDRLNRRVYAASTDCDEIAIFHAATGQSLGEIPLTGEPGYMTMDEEARQLLAVLPKDHRLAIINVTGGKIAALVEVGDRPYMAMVTP